MEYSNDDDDEPQFGMDEDEDDTEWRYSSFDVAEDIRPAKYFPSSACSSEVASGSVFHGKGPHRRQNNNRIILHFDLDCFYAQVEMIRNPELRDKPLGVQQKYIVVTCNYAARKHGVNKLMSVTDAKEKCPQLILVSGEDLTHYREISYKVTELLEEYSPLVERLGFDENFVDATELVEKRLRHVASSDVSVNGHIYNNHSIDSHVEEHIRLAVGSQIAAELRTALFKKLGLTSCAGIATNKILSKLVAGIFKPNQQTTLLPESTPHLLSCLKHLKKLPGVGYRTAQKLQSLGLSTIQDLQGFPLATLEKVLGATAAQRIHSLSHGVDEALVTPSGPPQSLSDEDSFKNISTETEVVQKTEELLTNLLDRMQKDGRQPRTARLTIRRFSATNKWFSRESRQCPIPNHIGQKIATGNRDVMAALVDILMKLFRKMIDLKAPFHLTLLNVCLSNLQPASTSTRSSIGFFLKHPNQSSFKLNSSICSQGESDNSTHAKDQVLSRHKLFDIAAGDLQETNIMTTSGENAADSKKLLDKQQIKSGSSSSGTDLYLPPGIDPEVFRQLPEDIQREITSTISTTLSSNACKQKKMILQKTASKGDISHFLWQTPQCESLISSTAEAENSNFLSVECRQDAQIQQNNIDYSSTQVAGSSGEHTEPHSSSNMDADPMDLQNVNPADQVPSHVDPKVFSELPAELQQELLSEWKQQETVSKIHVNKHIGKARAAKETKQTSAKSTQSNNLLKYFKPS
ncbi:DNA polymerase iota [Polyodon spathula]|uniref:DNA polymerase iota n=1 Tax=Polyodon spathula TaxID=7913 RepID=UPI001B7EB2A1|nr:DNA polymerase iota [Polyodon spathula]